MKTAYPSRVDLWLAVTMVGTPLTVVAVGACTLTESLGAGIVAMLTGCVVGGAIVALSLPCVYTLTDDSLQIKAGWLEEEIPLRKIRGAQESSSLWSAPALSLRRVKVVLEDGARVISPRDRAGFLADLAARLRKMKTEAPERTDSP